MTAELVKMSLPADNVVGDVNEPYCMMRNLEIERVALLYHGTRNARRCVDEMKKVCLERQAFGS
jgi:alkylation response protein AidB-like acyl-CoA dehydrogenase